MRELIAVDFDGVIHSHVSGWQGPTVIPDAPTPGAFQWLEGISEHYDITIHTRRASDQGGITAVYRWLVERGLPRSVLAQLAITDRKPDARVFVDDRAYRFDGSNWPSAQTLALAEPWHRVRR